MEPKKKHRKVLRTAFTKGANEMEQLLRDYVPPDGEFRQIQVAWEWLRQKHGELKIVDESIYEALLESGATEEDLLADVYSTEIYDKKFTDLRIRYEDLCEQRKPTMEDQESVASAASRNTELSSSSGLRGRRNFKLPVIELKKFDGSIREWLPFWAQFKKVHEDPTIDLGDKIEYLIQTTLPGSRARQLVESFPAMGENYEKIIEGMKARFGREDLQIEFYVRELLRLILGNATSGVRTDLPTLYDKIETQLRALETLGITSEKCSAMLFPLIESCLPEDLLRVWQRVGQQTLADTDEREVALVAGSTNSILEGRLKDLMRFLRNEVENEQRISLASEGFGLKSATSNAGKDFTKNRKPKQETSWPTAVVLSNSSETTKCEFCEGAHDSESCFKAQKFSLDRKRDVLSTKGACFRCLRIGHQSRKCRSHLRCAVCGKPHVILMCPELPMHKQEESKTSDRRSSGGATGAAPESSLANNTCSYVFLETLRVEVIGPQGSREIRALIDSGSQRSYIQKSTAQQLGFVPKRRERIVHCLFGGTEMGQKHDCFDIRLKNDSYTCTLEVLDQPTICKDIAPIFEGPWQQELRELNVCLKDARDSGPIELLIGADVAGKLYTGRRHILNCGLVAVETLLGWTLSGRIPLEQLSTGTTMTVFSLLNKDLKITDLWELDVLGITAPSEKRSRQEVEFAAKEYFQQTVRVNEEGRYEVRLPWLEGHPPLPSNYGVAKKRLETTIKKLKNEGVLNAYDDIFKEWLDEGIIEEVVHDTGERQCHYLPHRPVIKEERATTKIRPVFDASAREKDRPALNHCLEKGMNLIELIPKILLRFRQQKIGVISDIRKAFLQIGLHETDRDFLRFLWVNEDGSEKVFRHRRVVFGVNSSPFLLGATIERHLEESRMKCGQPNSRYTEQNINQLSRSFYVDNCVTSVPDEDAVKQFIQEASMLMAEGQFDLRGWEFSHSRKSGDSTTPVLGLIWDSNEDRLRINRLSLRDGDDIRSKVVTKRLILSVAQRIFDPIGYTCPVTLRAKLLLQRTWEGGIGWDAPVNVEIKQEFCDWVQELSYLSQIEIPRWICAGPGESTNGSLHTFCDASKDAYAAVVFLRIERHEQVFVYLLAARTRVAPMKRLTIPRLELLAATIGARLGNAVKDGLDIEVERYFWSDSSTVVSWIRRKEEWAPFVWNRVAEIRSLSAPETWRHVPGTFNPADLPSRGCSAKQLFEQKWWEGPSWLYLEQDSWPCESLTLRKGSFSNKFSSNPFLG